MQLDITSMYILLSSVKIMLDRKVVCINIKLNSDISPEFSPDVAYNEGGIFAEHFNIIALCLYTMPLYLNSTVNMQAITLIFVI